ncbi:MAG TPA: hypothetical protein VNI61_04280 [Gemmatimonadales bacterium]|nr:hypothetical protein [Gemmatimonadales bacterium]
MTVARPGGRGGGWGGLVALLVAALPTASLVAQASPPGQRIDTIVIHNANVFDESWDGPAFLGRLANALHVTTRASVIRRTLLLDAGDPYDSARVAESERALRALNVFRSVRTDTARLGPRLALRVTTADGWSTKPQAGFSTAAGDETWQLGLVEENFLGLATTLTAAYSRTPDRDVLEFQYLAPHFGFRRAALLLEYSDRSDGRRGGWRYGVPFYQTAARWALWLSGEAANERVLVFRDGRADTARAPSGGFARRALRFGLSGGVALRATSRDYLRLWGTLVWRREDFDPTSVRARSVFAEAGVGVELGHSRFRVLEHFNSYARREDVDLSQVLRVGVWAAPRAWGYPAERAGLGPELAGQFTAVWPRGFAALRGQASGVLTASGLDSARVRASLTVADQNLPRQTWVLFLEGGVARGPKPGGEFDPWMEQRGPRLFGAHAFTGTRLLWGTVENRILLADNVWGLVGVGLAPFLDYGGAWYADQRPRLGGNVGLSLRLGPTRSVRAEAGEIAVGVRFGRGWGDGPWAVAVRKGFVF